MATVPSYPGEMFRHPKGYGVVMRDGAFHLIEGPSGQGVYTNSKVWGLPEGSVVINDVDFRRLDFAIALALDAVKVATA